MFFLFSFAPLLFLAVCFVFWLLLLLPPPPPSLLNRFERH